MTPSKGRILYISPEIAVPDAHGGSTHVMSAVQSFVRLGYSVLLLSHKRPGQPFFERYRGVAYIRVPCLPTGIGRNLSYVLATLVVSLFSLLFCSVDVVYERARLFGGFSMFVGRLFGKKTIYEMIEPYTEIPVALGKIKKPSLSYSLIRAVHDLAVFFSTSVLITHESFFDVVPRKKARMVSTGVDLRLFSPRSRSKVAALRKRYGLVSGKTFVYNGSFREWHMLIPFLRSFSTLLRTSSQSKLLLLGKSGYQYENVRAYVAEHHLERNVIFVGQIPFVDVPLYLQAADIGLLLFDREYPPFKKFSYFYSPIRTKEYMASGLALLASNFGSLRTMVVDGVHGSSVNEHSPRELLRAMKRLVSNPAHLRTIQLHNRREASRLFDWDIINKEILSA